MDLTQTTREILFNGVWGLLPAHLAGHMDEVALLKVKVGEKRLTRFFIFYHYEKRR